MNARISSFCEKIITMIIVIRYRQQAGCTHPTGMHTCYYYEWFLQGRIQGCRIWRRSSWGDGVPTYQ